MNNKILLLKYPWYNLSKERIFLILFNIIFKEEWGSELKNFIKNKIYKCLGEML